MKIVVFGLSISSSWGNGHATLWRGLCRALAERGHRIQFFERNVPYYAEHRDLASSPYFDLRLYPSWDLVSSVARRAVSAADVAIVTSYCPDGPRACDLVLANAPGIRVFYDLDTPVTLEHIKAGRTVAYLPKHGLGDFDLVLSYTGGFALDELQELLHAKRVAPLYGSVDPHAHHPAAQDSRFLCDLSYIGTYAADRQSRLNELFIRAAQCAPHRRFLLGGPLYPDSIAWPSNVERIPHVPPPEHPAFYSSSRLTLNVTRKVMADYGYCPSGRLFEAAACGVPIVSDTWLGLDAFFAPGEQIVAAKSTDDVLAALALPDRALQQMADRAQDRAFSEHTADKRAMQFLDLIRSAQSSAHAPRGPESRVRDSRIARA